MSFTTNRLEIFDSYLNTKITFELSQESDIFISKNFTVSQSESGLDLTIQHLSIQFVTKFRDTLDYKVRFNIKEVI